MENNKFFCPNCGTEINRNVAFCPECGFNVKQYLDNLQKTPKDQPKDPSSKTTAQHSRPAPKKNRVGDNQARPVRPTQRAPRKPIKKWKVITSVIVLAILVGGYLFLNNYYSKKATANRLVTAIKQGQDKTLASLITSNDPSFKPTSSNVEPLVTYYGRNKDKLASLKSSLTSTGYVNDHLKFVNSGHKFLIFDNYKLKVKPIYPRIRTNKKNAKLSINGKVVASQMKTTDPKKFGPYIPGEYRIKTSATIHGHKLVNNGDYAWIDPSGYDLDIQSILQTISYTIKGQTGSKVYLSGKEIGKIDKSGFYDIKDYPFSQNMTVALSMKTQSGKVVSSKNTKIDMSMNNTTITPQYPGFASTDDAKDLINSVWGDLSDGTVTDSDSANDDDYDDYFVGGSTSDIYQQMIKMVDGYQNDDSISDYTMDPTLKKVVPYDTGQTKVTYDVKYSFDHDDHYHIQTFEYNAIIQKSGSSYKMKTNVMDHKVNDYDKDE
jgi:uncharacterized membrane protein YvbJ